MFDPRAKDLTKLTDTELTEKIGKLLNRMNFFQQSGHTASYQQCYNIYQALIQEQMDRIQKSYITDNDQFGDLIDIPKK